MITPNVRNATYQEIMHWAQTAPREDLIGARAELQLKHAAITSELEAARLNPNSVPKFRKGSEWYLAASRAKRLTGVAMQQIQMLLAAKKEDVILARVVRHDAQWQEVARDMLDPETFERLSAEVVARRHQAEQVVAEAEREQREAVPPPFPTEIVQFVRNRRPPADI